MICIWRVRQTREKVILKRCKNKYLVTCVLLHVEVTFPITSRSTLEIRGSFVRSAISHSIWKSQWRPTCSSTLGTNRTQVHTVQLFLQWSFLPQNAYIKKHTREKLYHWYQCEYKTPNSSNLKRHIKMHTREHFHHCNDCEYKTLESGDLRRHKNAHSGEKAQRCPMCDYSCSKIDSLKLYMMRKHTGDKPFKCNQCNCAGICSIH